eukprot:1048562-Rhodomonas_salina.2
MALVAAGFSHKLKPEDDLWTGRHAAGRVLELELAASVRSRRLNSRFTCHAARERKKDLIKDGGCGRGGAFAGARIVSVLGK